MIDYTTWDCKQQRVKLKVGQNNDATQALFYEFPTGKNATYTLKNDDVMYKDQLRVSAYQVYMHSVDEYDAAIKLVGSMKHWRKLCDLKWFMEGMPEHSFEGLESWREDMALRDASLAKKQLQESAMSGNVNAQKILYGSTEKKPKVNKEETPESKKKTADVLGIVESINKARTS